LTARLNISRVPLYDLYRTGETVLGADFFA
jgi:hypothetical protein